MRAKEFLKESVTFHPIHQEKDSQGREYWTGYGKNEDVECWVCKGTGKDTYEREDADGVFRKYTYDCDMCRGKGKYKDWVPEGPEMNVSNSSAFKICEMLGLVGDYAGVWTNEELPGIMRKLIKLKNADLDQYTEPGSVSKGPMHRYKDDQGMDRIGHGATMYSGGYDRDRVLRYVDSLIEIVKYAQEKGASVGWG